MGNRGGGGLTAGTGRISEGVDDSGVTSWLGDDGGAQVVVEGGPAPLDAWRCAMGWSEVAARSHARRLEGEGWLARYPMMRGHGSLFVATRLGVAVASVPVRAAGEPAPTWWAHHCGCAWMAAWLTVRGREFIGGRELLGRDEWSDKIRWRDHKGQHDARHRPDLVGIRADGRPVAVEVELAQKSVERLKAILHRHALWRAGRKTNGVWYVCGDKDGRERIRKVADASGCFPGDDPGLVLELLETIGEQAIQARNADPDSVGFRRLAAHAVARGS